MPFVLAIGIGFSVAVGSAEGFGMLTIMSVAPIIAVLVFSKIRAPAQKAGRQLSRAARSMSKSMRRPQSTDGVVRRFKYGQSTVQVRVGCGSGCGGEGVAGVRGG